MAVGRSVAAIGDNCVDLYVEPVARRFAGGNAYNVAVQLARRGFAAEYLGAVADDVDGRQLRAALGRAGVSTERLRVLPGRTAVTRIELRGGGERVFLDDDLGVVADYRPGDDDLDRAAAADVVHCAVLAEVPAVLAALRDRRARVSYDFSTLDGPPDLGALDVAFFAERPGIAPLELARSAVAAGARTAIVTCGREGSVAFERDAAELVGAAPVQPLDTTGAGDAYIAAFLAERLDGAPLRACMEAATEAAAATCLHLGGWPDAELPQVARA